jgi:23S rRNA maturation mini-RNase III
MGDLLNFCYGLLAFNERFFRDVRRWGKNIVSSKTKTKKRAGAAVYNRASSLETLVSAFKLPFLF